MAPKDLPHKEALLLVELMRESIECTSQEDFQALFLKLQDLLPFDYAIAGLCTFEKCGRVQTVRILNISYPEDWLRLYLDREHQHIDPIVKENFTLFSLQRWENTFTKHPEAQDFINDAYDFGLIKGYTNGVHNRRQTEGSLFSFAGSSVEYHPRTEAIIQLITPHLNIALTNVIDHHQKKRPPTLSLREKEILKWAGIGKTTWEISQILHISERTVYFHLTNIFKKLDVMSRTQAVATAVEMGLIKLN